MCFGIYYVDCQQSEEREPDAHRGLVHLIFVLNHVSESRSSSFALRTRMGNLLSRAMYTFISWLGGLGKLQTLARELRGIP